MEGYCRGCLVKHDEPTDLIPYSEKNRRLFIYSTGLQVKRNDTFTFQLCKECYLNMKQSCSFKKQCRNSEKKLKNYFSLKEDGDVVDFCSYIKNCEDLLTIRLPLTSGNSTPAHQKIKEDDNESTCTSIRNFMSDILQGEEVPDTEARIIKELIEEEADVLDDSLDSHWLQDDMSIATDFRMDFSFSPFSTPRSVQNDHSYTPKRLNDEKDDYFTLKQIEKPPDDEQYHMPILDDCEIDIDQPANIPMDDIKTDCYTQTTEKTENYEINNSKVNETESQKYETENQNYEVNNIVKINLNSKSEQEIYFVEQITEMEPKENVENDFFHMKEKTEDFITTSAATEIENDFYNITNDCNQSKVAKKIDESSLLNNELEYYISKAELKKKSTIVDNNKCLIDRNLEKALENEDNKEIPLDILLSSPKVDIRSGASTPTIKNILFGDTLLDSNDSPKLGQCIEKFHPIEGQTNILDDFFKDEDSNNVENVKIKEEIVSDFTFNSFSQVKNKIEILEIKVIKEKHIEDREIENKFNEGIESENKLNESDLISKEEKNEDIKDLIDDYVTNVYDKIDAADQDRDDEEIDALELLKATNTILDDNIFKRPLSPMYDKYDLEKSECKICNKIFKTQLNLKIHFTKKHKFKIVDGVPKRGYLKVEVCDVCGQTVKGKANLNRHKKQIHGGEFTCKICLLQFSTQHGLNIHRNSHKENLVKNTSKVYTEICNICGKKVSSSNLKIHLLRHLKEFKFKCEICGKGFYRQSEHKIHLRTHTNSRPYQCQICLKSYKLRFSLMRHNKRHLENHEFICDICCTRFTSKQMLKNHFGTKQCSPENKSLEKVCNPDNKKFEEQCSQDKTSEKECNNPDNKISEEQCSQDKTSEKECNPDNKISEEQCSQDKTSEKECDPDNKTSEEQCSQDKTSEKEYNPDNKILEEQRNLDIKTSEIIPEDILKSSELSLDVSNEKTEEFITEKIEFTVKFSPISVREDEPSDPLLDLY